MVEKRKDVPFCSGEYERLDLCCDGDSEGESKYQQNPCIFRDRCAAFRLHLEETNKIADDFVKVIPDPNGRLEEDVIGIPRKGRKWFVAFCDEQIARYGIVDGEATKDPSSPKKIKGASPGDKRKDHVPSKKATKKAKKALAVKAKERKVIMKRLFDCFKTCLVESLVGYKFTPPGGAVSPGRFYIIDRTENSGYISVYCKRVSGRDAPVALVKFKPRSMTFDIETPVKSTGYVGVGEITMSKLRPKPINDGRFRSIMMGLDKEGVAMAAETIAHLVKRGKIELPTAHGGSA